jgi:hypothetical protein
MLRKRLAALVQDLTRFHVSHSLKIHITVLVDKALNADAPPGLSANLNTLASVMPQFVCALEL